VSIWQVAKLVPACATLDSPECESVERRHGRRDQLALDSQWTSLPVLPLNGVARVGTWFRIQCDQIDSTVPLNAV
jgi:hypothetical protein